MALTTRSFFFLGFGMAMTLALHQVFVANLANNTMLLGTYHGSYGLGGTIAPLIATAMVSHGLVWSRFYLLSLAVACFNLGWVGWAFWGDEGEESTRLLSHLRPASMQGSRAEPSRLQILKTALQNKVTILGALFIFAYQGAEVSMSSWIISFLITYRRGDPADVGYVTAGFWGGITVGRFLFSQPAERLGKRVTVTAVVGAAAAFQLLVWLVPNVVGNAVAVAIVGLLLGPVYVCATAVFTQLLPRPVQTSAMGFISATGSSGGAVAPFMTGLGSQVAGTWILHPVCIGLYAAMEISWLLLPKTRKRTE